MTERRTNVPLLLISILLVVIGFAWAMSVLPQIAGMTHGSVRIVVPGYHTVQLDEAGHYTIFHETISEIDGERYESNSRMKEKMVFDVRHENGEIILVESALPYSKYNRGTRSRGYSAFQFDLAEPGSVQFMVEYSDGSESPESVLSITHWNPYSGVNLLRVIGGFGLISAGVICTLWSTGWRRGRGQQTQPYIYEHRIDYRGDAQAAFEIAERVLQPLDFSLDYEGSDTLYAKGPGMQSSKQFALQGVTSFHFTIGANTIRVRAELGGVRNMRNFLMLFIPGTGIFFIILFGVMALGRTMPMWGALLILVPLAPWIFIGPAMIGHLRRRTTSAIDTLLDNMANANR